METARALGNLSRHAATRRVIKSLKIDEIVVILMDLDSEDLLYYLCGILVNLAADPDCNMRLVMECSVVPRLLELLESAGDDLIFVILKVLVNLAVVNSADCETLVGSGAGRSLVGSCETFVDHGEHPGGGSGAPVGVGGRSPPAGAKGVAPLFAVLDGTGLEKLRRSCEQLLNSGEELSALAGSFLKTLPRSLDVSALVSGAVGGTTREARSSSSSAGCGRGSGAGGTGEDGAKISVVPHCEASKGAKCETTSAVAGAGELLHEASADKEEGPPTTSASSDSGRFSLERPSGSSSSSVEEGEEQEGGATSSSSRDEELAVSSSQLRPAPPPLGPPGSRSSGSPPLGSPPEGRPSPKKRLAQNYHSIACGVPDCGRKFSSQEQLEAHVKRRHAQ